MSIDSQVDEVITAIAALVRGAVQAELGNDVLLTVYEDPRDLFTIPASKLPALCVHRVREQPRRQSSTQLVDDIVVGFEYALPSTSVDGRGVRWPTLAAVWRSLRNAVLAGKHAAVSDGAEILLAAGCWADEETARVLSYTLVDGGRDSEPEMRARHPLLVAQILVTQTPDEVDADTLHDFLRFTMTFDQPGGDHTDPLITLHVILPT